MDTANDTCSRSSRPTEDWPVVPVNAFHAAANAGTLYTAKGTAAMLVPVASLLSANGGWSTVFISAAVISIAAAICAKFVLAPMRKRWIENSGEPAGVAIVEARLQQWPGGSSE